MKKKAKLGTILIKAGMIKESQLESALRYQKQWGVPLGEAMLTLGIIDEKKLLKVLSHQMQVPAVDLSIYNVSMDSLKIITPYFAKKNSVFPLKLKQDKTGETLHVATPDPLNYELLTELETMIGKKVKFIVATRSSIQKAIRKYYYHEKVDFHEETHGVLYKDVPEDELVILKGEDVSLADVDERDALVKKRIVSEETDSSPGKKTDTKISPATKAVINLLIRKNVFSKEEFYKEFDAVLKLL